ncbi:Putative recombination initiation defects 3, partial [Linum grandiflorum]
SLSLSPFEFSPRSSYTWFPFTGVRSLSAISRRKTTQTQWRPQMKLKINKACDLTSISVLPPPHSRRLSSVQPGTQQSSQLRSGSSQQSFSQGFSSQHGMFSQFSQTSLDEAFVNDQRLNSQERENRVKKASSVPPPTDCTREESQMPNSRSSVTLMRKWNRGSTGEGKCQVSDELEHRIGTIETSLNKFGMMMDSVQRDIMQVNKGTKEVLLEVDGIRQKLVVLDTSLLTVVTVLTNKGLGDVKSTFDESLKSMTEQHKNDASKERIQEMSFLLSSLPGQMEASLLKLQDTLHASYIQEMQAMIRSMKTPKVNSPHPVLLPPKDVGPSSNQQRKPEIVEITQASAAKMPAQATDVRREDNLGWKSIKREQTTYSRRKTQSQEEQKHEPASTMQERGTRISIDSDEEIDGGLSCLIDPNETGTGNFMVDEAKEETERILRRARRRKRKTSCFPIIID